MRTTKRRSEGRHGQREEHHAHHVLAPPACRQRQPCFTEKITRMWGKQEQERGTSERSEQESGRAASAPTEEHHAHRVGHRRPRQRCLTKQVTITWKKRTRTKKVIYLKPGKNEKKIKKRKIEGRGGGNTHQRNVGKARKNYSHSKTLLLVQCASTISDQVTSKTLYTT